MFYNVTLTALKKDSAVTKSQNIVAHKHKIYANFYYLPRH